jgi:hypothetical protein
MVIVDGQAKVRNGQSVSPEEMSREQMEQASAQKAGNQ